MIVNIGLDVGFGDVKIIAGTIDEAAKVSTANTTLKYPTAVAYAKAGIIGSLGSDEEEYDFNGRTYLVGKTALQCHDLFSTRDIEFLLRYSPLLIYKAIKDVATAENIQLSALLSAQKRLCLGIPLAYYNRRHELENSLANYTVCGDIVSFDTIDVRAQSQGILFDYMVGQNGQPVEGRIDKTVLVIDIGFNTVDVLGIVAGRPSKEWSGMIEHGGICRICDDLKNYLQTEFNCNLSEQVVKDIICNGYVNLYGNKKDLSTPIRSFKEAYCDWLIQEINSRWDKFLKRADRLIIAGGGSYYTDSLQEGYPSDFVIIPDTPEFGNARGFFKYLMADKESA